MKNGWEIKKLADVCEFFNDGNWIESKDQSTTGYRLIQTGNVGIGEFRNKSGKERYVSESTFRRLNCTEIFPGDILISRLPDPVGRACIVPELEEKLITAVDCSIIRLKKNVLITDYFKYYTQSQSYFKNISKNITGTTRDRISRTNLGSIILPVPSINEQQQIVAILDDVFETFDQAKENIQRNLQNSKDLFQSDLNRIFTIKGESWVKKSIEEIAKVVNGFSFKSEDFSSTNKIKSVKITNVGVKEFIEEEGNFLPEQYENLYSNYSVKEGNIVIALTRTIISRGLKVAVVPNRYHGALINQRVAALVSRVHVISQRFLYNFLCTDMVANYVKSNVNTLMQPNLSINDLKKLLVPIPSIEEQMKIVQRLDALSDEIKRLEVQYQNKLNYLEELKKSILNKAFTGELTKTPEIAA